MEIKESSRLSGVSEYYFSKKLQEIREMNAKGENVINLGIGNPDLPPSENTISALYNSAKGDKNHGYQGYKGIPEFRSAISNWYKKIYDVNVNPETEILPLLGSKEGVFHITMAFVNPGDKVLIPNPGYPAYEAVSKLAGAEIISYDLLENKNWEIDIEQIKSFDLNEVKILWTNFPNMPTGAKGSQKIFLELIELAEKYNFLIVNDNPYSTILNEKPESIMKISGAFSCALELNSMSKSHNLAGWRIGWITGNEKHINSVLKFKSNIDSGMFLSVQHAAIEAFKNSDDWYKNQNDIYFSRKEIVFKILDFLNCSYNKSQGGMYVWAKIPENVENSAAFSDEILYKSKVFLTPGIIFGSNGNRFIRISLTSSKETFENALSRITETFVNKSKQAL